MGTVRQRCNGGTLPTMNPFLTFQHLCKFHVQFLENGAVDLASELVGFHSRKIVPKALTASTFFVQAFESDPNLRQCLFHKAVLGGH